MGFKERYPRGDPGYVKMLLLRLLTAPPPAGPRTALNLNLNRVLFGLCFVRCSGAVRFQTFGGGFLVGGFVQTIGFVREFRRAVLFLFGRSLENVFVL